MYVKVNCLKPSNSLISECIDQTCEICTAAYSCKKGRDGYCLNGATCKGSVQYSSCVGHKRPIISILQIDHLIAVCQIVTWL